MKTAPLAGYQKRFLKGLAHGLRPLVHVGKGGVTETVLEAVDHQLAAHELIKVRLLEPESKKSMAADLAAGSESQVVALVGHVVVLFRRSDQPAGSRIRLPNRDESESSPS